MTFNVETILVLIIVAAALALGYARHQRASRRRTAGDHKEAKVAKRQTEKPSEPKSNEAAATRRSKRSKPSASPAPETQLVRTAIGTGLFDGVTSWGYQLQKVKVADVAASPFGMMVVDYSADGTLEQAFQPADVARMQTMPTGGRRLVLAYLSVGEAESYRFYWDPAWTADPPSWIVGENPEWEGNYAVRFWEPAWQRLMFGAKGSYLDRIMDAGFDGVYLDKCDVFEDFQQVNAKVSAERPQMEGDMIDFVVRLSRYAKGRNPRFAIVMQNAEVLLEHEGLRMAIDGVAKEELLYGYDRPEKANPKDEVAYSKRSLELARKAGRSVFVVEYLSDRDKASAALSVLDGYGYIGTVSGKNRELDRLNPDPAAIV